jgi:DNA-directed RNA polymerase subunit beta
MYQIVHGRNWSYLGPGGLTGGIASFRIRDVHPSTVNAFVQLTRCPSEGINAGLIGSLAIHARIDLWGADT